MAAVDKGSGKSEKITITNDKGEPRPAMLYLTCSGDFSCWADLVCSDPAGRLPCSWACVSMPRLRAPPLRLRACQPPRQDFCSSLPLVQPALPYPP